MRLTLSFLLGLYVQLCIGQTPLATHYNEAKKAYNNQDYAGYLRHTLKADSISPNHPTLTYNLASGYALTEENEKSMAYLKKAVLMNVALYPKDDADFQNIEKLPAFKEITSLKNKLISSVQKSEVAFTLSEKDLHPESIVYDPTTKSFLIGSVHKNKIISYNTLTNKVSNWKETEEDGLWAVMGMKRDAKKKVLWVCTAITKEMINYKKELDGKTALYKYDLSTKKLLKRYELDGGHWFGDLVLDEAGRPFISDSKKPIVYTVENDELTVLRDFSDELFNLQGIAFGSNQDDLFIADYKLGLHVYSMKQKQLIKVTHPDHLTTKGIDGLYSYKGSLIGIHNGVNPFRICQYSLDETNTNITGINYIDRSREELGEPTLGVITRGTFYYIANSPWGKYDKEANLKVEELTDNIILKYVLGK